MKKRTFIKTSSILVAASAVAPFAACKGDVAGPSKAVSGFTLPALPYAFDALAPNIDALTMEIHHDKHHAGYVNKLNAAIDGTKFSGQVIEDILSGLTPSDTAVRNNGGGHYNHSLFWSVMSPSGGGLPSGKIADALNAEFDSFEAFKKSFSDAASGRFGSGWAWLCQKENGQLFITSTPNQDNPLMVQVVENTGKPLLGIDVWEHAYYLNYQNRRGDYINNFFNIINWNEVNRRLI